MSESSHPAAQAIEHMSPAADHTVMVRSGLEQAGRDGFNLNQSVTANYGENASLDMVAERTNKILGKTVEIAADLELDESFFDTPANTVLLAAIADSWIETDEKIASANGYDEKLAAERDMLVDGALMLAGSHSIRAQALGEGDPVFRDRYIEANEADDLELEKQAFLESIKNPELSAQVKALLSQVGVGSFLAAERANLGTSHSEDPFEVRVLNLSEKYKFQDAGVLPRAEYPDRNDLSEAAKIQTELSIAENNRQDVFAAPFLAASKEYTRLFGKKFGSLPEAFVEQSNDGKTVLTLQAHTAMGLIKYIDSGMPAPVDATDARRIEREFGVVKHEYAHTQKRFVRGAQHQLGIVLEERKAELVSGDTGGYQDIKYLMKDLGSATGVSIGDLLSTAVLTDDPLSSFAINAANNIGLRNTLSLIIDKPTPYDRQTEHAKKFANLRGMRQPSDLSSHDSIVRRDIEKRGSKIMNASAAEWLGAVVSNGYNPQFMRNSFFGNRRRQGIGVGTAYLENVFLNSDYGRNPNTADKVA